MRNRQTLLFNACGDVQRLLNQLRLKTAFDVVGVFQQRTQATEDEAVAALANPLPADPMTPEDREGLVDEISVIATAAWSDITVPLAKACREIGRSAQLAKLPNAIDADELAATLSISPGSPPNNHTLRLAKRVEGLVAQVERLNEQPSASTTKIETTPSKPTLTDEHWWLLDRFSDHTSPARKSDILPRSHQWSDWKWNARAHDLESHGYVRLQNRKLVITARGRSALSRHKRKK